MDVDSNNDDPSGAGAGAGAGAEAGHLKACTQLACDFCRLRKVKCDEKDPCSQCTAAKKECKRTYQRKPREKRQRVLVSGQYEEKIDRIEERLDTLIDLLNNLKASPSSHQLTAEPPDQAITSNNFVSTPNTGDTPRQLQNVEPSYEGESSLAAHSRFANDFMLKTLHHNPSASNPTALNALKELAAASTPQPSPKDAFYDNTVPTSRPSYKHELPPFSAIAAIIKTERESASPSFGLWLSAVISMDTLTQHCLDVYYTPVYSDFQLIIVTAAMLWIFSGRCDFAASQQGQVDVQTMRNHANLCLVALETTLSRLPLHIQPSLEAVQALLMAAFHAVSSAKPALAWSLSCRATELAQSLGLHRASTTKGDSRALADSKIATFWLLYTVDKGLSLRLGRSSSVQDYDVDLPRRYPSSILGENSGNDAYLNAWLACARIQGDVYEKLYSPYALNLPPAVREGSAYQLARDLSHLRTELRKTFEHIMRVSDLDSNDMVFLKADDVCVCGLFTLIYRAIPPEQGSNMTFNQSCIVAARQALEAHQSCMDMLRPGDKVILELYLNWSVLYVPFIPVIVMFCTIIETLDSNKDLELLRGFVQSLQGATSLSPSIEKLFRLFQTLYNVAEHALESHSAAAAASQQTGSSELAASSSLPAPDAYLNAMGIAALPWQQHQNVQGHPGVPGDGTAFDPTAAFGGWQGQDSEQWTEECQQMLDMLQDQDLQLFGTNFLSDGGGSGLGMPPQGTMPQQ